MRWQYSTAPAAKSTKFRKMFYHAVIKICRKWSVVLKLPFGHFEKDLWANSTLFGGVLHGEASPLQHVAALFLALQQSTGDLLWIQTLGVWQAWKCKLRCRPHHVRVTTTRCSVGQRCRFLWSQVAFPRLDENLNCLVANLDGLACIQQQQHQLFSGIFSMIMSISRTRVRCNKKVKRTIWVSEMIKSPHGDYRGMRDGMIKEMSLQAFLKNSQWQKISVDKQTSKIQWRGEQSITDQKIQNINYSLKMPMTITQNITDSQHNFVITSNWTYQVAYLKLNQQ